MSDFSRYDDLDCWPQVVRAAHQGQPKRISKHLGITHGEALRLGAEIRAASRPAKEDDKRSEPTEDELVFAQGLRDENARLRRQLRDRRRDDNLAQRVMREAMGLSQSPLRAPSWISETRPATGSAGVPTLLLSDLHWGEVVRPEEVHGLNEFDLEIAAKRLRRVTEGTIDLLRNHVTSPQGYDGIVVALGGDMISGGIHEELAFTDALPPAGCVMDLVGHLVACLRALADEFGKIYVPCVTGNHGRATRKPWKKMRIYTSWEWMAYAILAREFASDDRVTIQISEHTDLLYTVAGHRYMLTHGDSLGVRGGDGIIGALGPIMRGRHKVASASGAVGREFDCLVMGHWHQYMSLPHVIVNSSLKGYDEYARAQRFSYEPPSQALWLTHPKHGKTISMPVLAEEPRQSREAVVGF